MSCVKQPMAAPAAITIVMGNRFCSALQPVEGDNLPVAYKIRHKDQMTGLGNVVFKQGSSKVEKLLQFLHLHQKPIITIILTLLVIAFVAFYFRRRTSPSKENEIESSTSVSEIKVKTYEEFSSDLKEFETLLDKKNFTDSEKVYLSSFEEYVRSCEILADMVEFGSKIGAGSFGTVYKGLYNKTTHVAIKTSGVSRDAESKLDKSFKIEVSLLW